MLLRFVFTCCFVQIALQNQLLGDERQTFDELYDVLMVRHARNGEAYGENEIAPMIFKFSAFPFDDVTYPRLSAALDALTPENIESYSVVQRAILQRQLWSVLDATTPSRFVTRRPHTRKRRSSRNSDPAISEREWFVHYPVLQLISQNTMDR